MTDERYDLICIDAPKAEAIRGKLLGEEAAQEAADRARALSDPTRLTLAAALREGEELCVCDLSWIAGRSQNLVSHHLRTLRSLGMVRSRRDGKLVMYTLTNADPRHRRQAGGRTAQQLATPVAAPEASRWAEPSLGRRPTHVNGSLSYETIARYSATSRAGA